MLLEAVGVVPTAEWKDTYKRTVKKSGCQGASWNPKTQKTRVFPRESRVLKNVFELIIGGDGVPQHSSIHAVSLCINQSCRPLRRPIGAQV